jgi:hypothetical protein
LATHKNPTKRDPLTQALKKSNQPRVLALLSRVLTSASTDLVSFSEISVANFPEFKVALEKVSGKKSPPGLVKEMNTLKYILSQIEKVTEFGKSLAPIALANIKSAIQAVGVDSLDSLLSTLTGRSSENITTTRATFINSSTLSDAAFKERVSELDAFLRTLKPPHDAALGRNLTIRFVRKEQVKASAKYKRDKDEILLRPDRKIVTGDGYGSFVYVLLHELGHRYERNHNTSQFDSAEWVTTPYSATDNINGNEQFAELFALSHWPNKYGKYAEKITKFLAQI